MLRLLRIRTLGCLLWIQKLDAVCASVSMETQIANMMVCNPRSLHMQAFKVKQRKRRNQEPSNCS